jgi:hypothetical protein
MGLGIPILDDILGGGGGVGGGSSSISVTSSTELKPDPLRTENKQELVLPQPFKTEARQELVLPQPFKTEGKTESRNELAITQPIVTDSRNSLSLDVKPIAVDLCMKMSMGSIPPVCIRQPYHHHFGITMFGVEVLGFTFSGESQTIIQDLPPRPQLEWRPARSIEPQPRSGSGLRVRLGDR